MEPQKESKKDVYPILLTLILLVLSLVIFFIVRGPNLNLWVPISLYGLIDFGFLVALIWGAFSKNIVVKVFSILGNATFMVGMSAFVYLLLLAQGISEP